MSIPRWRGKAISSGWLIRRSPGGLAAPRPQPPSQAARCRHVAPPRPPPLLPRALPVTCHPGAPPRPDPDLGQRVTLLRRAAVITRWRDPARAGTRQSQAQVEARPPPHPQQPRQASAPARIMASGRASISEKQLPTLTDFLLTCSVTWFWHLNPGANAVLFQVWMIGVRMLFCIKCWPLVSRSTWRASKKETLTKLQSQGRRLRGRRRIRRVESDDTSEPFFKPVLNQ